MIRLEHISKSFETGKGTVEAVKDVSLHIEKGEIAGIIGFSGAGKSTLARCINLLERPTGGRVIIGGEELTAMSERALREKRKKIGMIFQHFNLFASRTVYGNVAYPLKGRSRQETDRKVKSLLELVGLSDKADAYPSQLSHPLHPPPAEGGQPDPGYHHCGHHPRDAGDQGDLRPGLCDGGRPGRRGGGCVPGVRLPPAGGHPEVCGQYLQPLPHPGADGRPDPSLWGVWW